MFEKCKLFIPILAKSDISQGELSTTAIHFLAPEKTISGIVVLQGLQKPYFEHSSNSKTRIFQLYGWLRR